MSSSAPWVVSGITGFNLYSMVVAIIGAVVVLVVYHLVRGRRAFLSRKATGLLDDVLGSAVPDGNLAKPLMVGLAALLARAPSEAASEGLERPHRPR